MNNFNLDKNTTDKLNSILKDGNLNDMLSQIPPDAIQNLSNLINNSSDTTSNADNTQSFGNSSNPDSQGSSRISEDSSPSQTANNFNFNNICINYN